MATIKAPLSRSLVFQPKWISSLAASRVGRELLAIGEAMLFCKGTQLEGFRTN